MNCEHVAQIKDVPPPLDVCESCIEIGATWVHLRQCLECGRTGCCDNSPNTHATLHANATGHPMIRSGEPGEDWAWCYPDETVYMPAADGGWEVYEE